MYNDCNNFEIQNIYVYIKCLNYIMYCILCIMYVVSERVKLPTKTTTAKNGVALSYHRVRGLYFLAAVFAAPIVN